MVLWIFFWAQIVCIAFNTPFMIYNSANGRIGYAFVQAGVITLNGFVATIVLLDLAR